MPRKSDPNTGAKPLVARAPAHVPMKGAVQITGLSETTLRHLGDAGVIACIRDMNNERLFEVASLARFKALKDQEAAARIYNRAAAKVAQIAQEARAARRGR